MKSFAIAAFVGLMSTSAAIHIEPKTHSLAEYTDVDTWEAQQRAGVYDGTDTETEQERRDRELAAKIKQQIAARKAQNEAIKEAEQAANERQQAEDEKRWGKMADE